MLVLRFKTLFLNQKYRITSTDGAIYICITCHRTLKSNKVPAQSKANGMELEDIPNELKDLNNMELRLICKRLPFMKLVKLPRGKQRGIKGAGVNVPADLGPACNLLPRIPDDAHIISLKLKRKLEYRQAYSFDTIRPEKVITALHYLKSNNPLYCDIDINEEWREIWKEQDEELYDATFESNHTCNGTNMQKPHGAARNTSRNQQHHSRLQHDPSIPKSPSYIQLECAALRRGFKVKDVRGDGHCMFAALLEQMLLQGYQSQSIREFCNTLADYMENYPERYKPFMSLNVHNNMNDTEPLTDEDLIIEQIQDIEERKNMLWQRFLRRLRKDAWGDHVVIQAVAHMLNNTITILEHRNNYSNGYLTIIPPYGVTDENDYDDEKALHLGFIPQHHYTSLEYIETPSFESDESESDEDPGKQPTDDKTNNEETEDFLAFKENCKLRGLPYDTCLQSEIPEEASQIFSIAPGEGSKPIPLLTDNFFEQLANPDNFPNGKGSFADTKRHTKLTLRKYINSRLLDQDGRFAKDIEYILAMQYATEHKQVKDSINIACRQTKGRQQFGLNLHAGMLRNPQNIHNLIKQDRAYSFLKNIRGSPPYWQKMFYETLAMIRTLGIPTWFLTLSAADMKWPEVIQSIARQYGTIYNENEVKELPWNIKSMWLRSNPVTAARMFQHRLDAFFMTFLKSTSKPIGIITDYVIRIEFQARGSPHAHNLIWIKDAPKLGYTDEIVVKEFIDKYISCSIPEDDEILKTLV